MDRCSLIVRLFDSGRLVSATLLGCTLGLWGRRLGSSNSDAIASWNPPGVTVVGLGTLSFVQHEG